MSTLYELKQEFQMLYQMAEDDEDIEAFNDTLESLQGELHDKADGFAIVMNAMAADEDAIEKEEKRLYSRRQTIKAKRERMKAFLQDAMEIAGDTKFKTTLFSFNVQNNPASVKLDVPETDVPEFYTKPQPAKVDKKLILEALKNGEALDFAHIEQGRSLRIK